MSRLEFHQLQEHTVPLRVADLRLIPHIVEQVVPLDLAPEICGALLGSHGKEDTKPFVRTNATISR